MFTLKQMAQNSDDMQFCKNCKMNVFPTRPRFNTKLFILFIILVSSILIPLTIIYLPILSGLFIFLFLFWGFMILNPYLLYYIAKKKQFCPSCYQKVIEKNLDYHPFGKKEPEIYKLIAPDKKSFKWYCPYCGILLDEGARFCKSCGKIIEFQR